MKYKLWHRRLYDSNGNIPIISSYNHGFEVNDITYLVEEASSSIFSKTIYNVPINPTALESCVAFKNISMYFEKARAEDFLDGAAFATQEKLVEPRSIEEFFDELISEEINILPSHLQEFLDGFNYKRNS